MPARRELGRAVHYYNLQRTQLGDEFLNEAWQTIQRVKELPLAWHPMGGNIRRCQMRRFPYGIIYSPTESEITVIAIACLHQEPSYWRDRVSGD